MKLSNLLFGSLFFVLLSLDAMQTSRDSVVVVESGPHVYVNIEPASYAPPRLTDSDARDFDALLKRCAIFLYARESNVKTREIAREINDLIKHFCKKSV